MESDWTVMMLRLVLWSAVRVGALSLFKCLGLHRSPTRGRPRLSKKITQSSSTQLLRECQALLSVQVNIDTALDLAVMPEQRYGYEAFGGAEHPAQRNERFIPGRDIDLQLFEKNATGVDRSSHIRDDQHAHIIGATEKRLWIRSELDKDDIAAVQLQDVKTLCWQEELEPQNQVYKARLPDQ
ncbi:hypothetical protein BJ912DRAFT_1128153 [Pholiota molesta]|nr:hypothetical protein BJ912DRAFT_1128153 [Pholiota molesta]